jgi:ZIP family zinc transporter
MTGYLLALILALVPAAGNFLGGVAAEVLPSSRRTLGFALHTAAGVIIALVAVEIAPRARAAGPWWAMAAAFAAGGLFFILVDMLLGIARERAGLEGGRLNRPWLVYLAVAVDLLSDGVMVGVASTIAPQLALLLAVGQVAADVPEGFATVATLRRANVPRRARLLLGTGFALPVLAGATAGFLAGRGVSDGLKAGLLVFTAGVLVTATIEEIVPEAHQGKESRWNTLCFVAGFAGFWALSAVLGPG